MKNLHIRDVDSLYLGHISCVFATFSILQNSNFKSIEDGNSRFTSELLNNKMANRLVVVQPTNQVCRQQTFHILSAFCSVQLISGITSPFEREQLLCGLLTLHLLTLLPLPKIQIKFAL